MIYIVLTSLLLFFVPLGLLELIHMEFTTYWVWKFPLFALKYMRLSSLHLIHNPYSLSLGYHPSI